jgi:hypothetical protein
MKYLFYIKNLYLPVFRTKSDDMSIDYWTFENAKVCGFIRQWVEDNVLNHIASEINVKELWTKLETLYVSNTRNNKLFLLKQVMHLTYKKNNSISDHLNDFQGCFDQLSDMGVKFNDEILALWLLNTLLDSWETFRVSSINVAPKGNVTMEYVKSYVLNKEM